ncbi:MAG: hypothetical protein ACK56I_01210, partial [bacterium]
PMAVRIIYMYTPMAVRIICVYMYVLSLRWVAQSLAWPINTRAGSSAQARTRTRSPCGADARAPCSCEHAGSLMLIYCYSAPGDSAAMLAHARQHSGHAHTDLHRAVGEARGARDLGLPVVSAAREAHHQEHLV